MSGKERSATTEAVLVPAARQTETGGAQGRTLTAGHCSLQGGTVPGQHVTGRDDRAPHVTATGEKLADRELWDAISLLQERGGDVGELQL
ncbi:hypothetical protein ACOMHN_041277 [Nucella lapillus]